MRRKLSNVYARVFDYFRAVMEWYLNSKTSRILSSFNENVKKRFDDAVRIIKEEIQEIHEEASVGGLAIGLSTLTTALETDRKIALISRNVDFLMTEVLRQRENYSRTEDDPLLAGKRMLAHLLDMVTIQPNLSNINDNRTKAWTIEISDDSTGNTHGQVASRKMAQSYSKHLEGFIVGDMGVKILSMEPYLRVDDGVLAELSTWIQPNSSSVLWLSSPFDAGELTSAKAAALGVVGSALGGEIPFISHFCERPRKDMIPESETIEQAGLIGMLYSLILQLLQFNIDDENIDLSEHRFKELDGGKECWPEALSLFSDLLAGTPHLPYCIIHNLNDLEWLSGDEWCNDFLNILFERQKKPGVFNLLFTTSGQSKVLSNRIDWKNHHMTTRNTREVQRRGERFEIEMP
jgi:hypothetical protein